MINNSKLEKLIPFLLFTFIFVIYFSSSVGLMNSIDTPQFFTTESLLKNGKIDISSYKNDPHYFIWPDYLIRKGMVLNQRGFLFSLVNFPIHFAAHALSENMSVSNFPSSILSISFKYELLVCGLFSIFSVTALIIIYSLINTVINCNILSSFMIVYLAFGTYIWKYSTTYARQGLLNLMISIFIWALYSIIFNKNTKFSLILIGLVWSISFGIDIVLFIIISILIIQLLLYLAFIKKSLTITEIAWFIWIPIIIISLNIFINYQYYGTYIFMQYDKNIMIEKTLKDMSQDKINTILSGTPIFPTIINVLFSFHRLPLQQFVFHDTLPTAFKTYLSVEYAKRYIFYGIFFISPLLLLSFMTFFFVRRIKIFIFLILLFELFFLGILGNLKTIGFWGGTQYDVRYFYPYVIPLALPTAITIRHFFTKISGISRSLLFVLLWYLFLYSICMGWLGVINMFSPALTGERRIWMDIYDLSSKLTSHSILEYLNATFLNRENAWIAVLLSLVGYVLFSIVNFMINYLKFLQHKETR